MTGDVGKAGVAIDSAEDMKILFDQIDLGRISAVSYTHLRAHETVLDLVCRLLLEKKKIAKIYQATHEVYESSSMLIHASATH